MAAKTTLLFQFATLCIFSIQALMFIVEADEALIKQLCSATPSPGVCSSCLDSDPGSKTATDIGLVEISMVCATNKMDLLYQDTFRYQGDSSTDPAMRDALNYCLDQFEDAKTKVNHVSDSVQGRDFAAAKQMISDGILGEVFSCKTSLQSKGLEVPLVVSSDLDVVSDYWNIVVGILGSVKSPKF